MRAWSSPGADRQGHAAEDLVVVDGDVEVVDLEERGVPGHRTAIVITLRP